MERSLTTAQAAARTGRSASYIGLLVRQGKLTPVGRLGTGPMASYLFALPDVEALTRPKTVAKAAPKLKSSLSGASLTEPKLLRRLLKTLNRLDKRLARNETAAITG